MSRFPQQRPRESPRPRAGSSDTDWEEEGLAEHSPRIPHKTLIKRANAFSSGDTRKPS